MKALKLMALAALTAAGMALAGCGEGTATQATASAPGEAGKMVLHRGNGAEPDSLDPHKAEGTWESAIIGDMLMGLYTDAPDASPIFGAAEAVEVSEDGKTWTFTIRDHVWSDGTPVTARDFVFAWQRILDPATAAKYASLVYVFKNARAINSGEMPADALGARAVDDRTLVVELEHPAPYLPELLTHQTTYPVPAHVIEAIGSDWSKPGNHISNGPYKLAEWRPNDHIRLVKSQTFYDAANVQIDEVYFYPIEDTQAGLKRFRAGELDVNDGLPSQQMDWIRANLAEELHLDDYLGWSYVAMNNSKAPFDDIRVRQALNLAFDRETIANQVLRFGEPPAYSVVPPGTANYPGGAAFPWKDMPQPERIARAKTLMQEAGFGPDNPMRVSLLIGNAPDSRRVGATVQQMWKEIFVELELQALETRVLYARIQEGDFDLSTAGWIADYNDAENFLYLFLSENIGMNYGRYSNPEFDRLIMAARNEKDIVRRGEKLLAAEKIVLADYATIPNRFLRTRNLVHTHVKGWVANLKDVNRTRWLSVERPGAQAAVN